MQPGDDPGKLWVYNFVPVDKYVRDIGEVDLDWAMPNASGYAPEAVKAQAVAARTYAMAKNGTLTDGWQDQYYAGYRLEAKYPGLARAAEETAGLILTYQGKPASTYFSAHSGGYTTDSAWSGAGSGKPYIVAQSDPWSLKAPPTSVSSAGPGWNWTYTISPPSLSAKVNNVLTDVNTKKKFDVGLLKRVEVATRDTADPSSHARTLKLTGDKGVAYVYATSLKSSLGLRSTLILTVTGGRTPGRGRVLRRAGRAPVPRPDSPHGHLRPHERLRGRPLQARRLHHPLAVRQDRRQPVQPHAPRGPDRGGRRRPRRRTPTCPPARVSYSTNRTGWRRPRRPVW